MKPCRRLLGGLLLATLALTCAAAPGGPPSAGKGHDSPEAVFKASQAALQTDDVKSFMLCLTADSQTLMAGRIAFGALMFKGAAALDRTGKSAEKVKAITAVFTRHGLTEETLQKLELSRDPKDLARSLRTLGGKVKDRVAFTTQLVAALRKANLDKPPVTPIRRKLTNLKIDGDLARGSVVSRKDGKETREPIVFTRLDGGWKITLPEPEAKSAPSSNPPPGQASPKPGERP